MMTRLAFVLACLVACPAWAQEGRLASDWRRERERLAEKCSEFNFTALASCTVALVTDYPFHIAVGNLAPRNGFGFGLAFSERYAPNENWRISFNADAVASTSKSWRTGTYITLVRSKVELPGVSTGPVGGSTQGTGVYPVFRVYAQHTALNRLLDFGPDFDNPQPREFGEDHTILGGSAVLPLNGPFFRTIAMSVSGGLNGRFIGIHDVSGRDTYTELFEEVRLKPTLGADRVRLNYTGRLQQFFGDRDTSFHRWTVDLRHEFPLYRTAASTGPNPFNGPNDCGTSPTDPTCPPLTFSRNLGGAVGVRLFAISSSPFDAAGQVPFYLQPTIGGADINGQRMLSSLDDYRFRAPHVIGAQVSLEHSIWGPLGGYVSIERGKATQRSSALDFSDLLSSYSTGLTIRAGGAPFVTASYSWGSGGNRVIVLMDTSLLGGSPRPSLH